MKKLLIVLGIPGSGKDTQIEELSRRRSAEVIRIGDLVREKAQSDPQLSKDLEEGNLADDELVNDLISHSIDGFPDDAFIISDGFPRDLAQAKWLEEFLSSEGIKLEHAMLLDVDDAVAMQRLMKRGREDDNEATIKHRFDVFHNKTDEVVKYFDSKGILVRIDGNGTPEQVQDDIKEKLSW